VSVRDVAASRLAASTESRYAARPLCVLKEIPLESGK